MTEHHHRSVPCPAHGVALQLGAVATAGVAVTANAHAAGIEAMRAARERHSHQLWRQRLIRARASASEALSVARAAVNRVHDLEEEVAALRRAVNSRDALIRSLSGNG